MIELYDIGPNPCVREIFVEHLPKEKIGPTPIAHEELGQPADEDRLRLSTHEKQSREHHGQDERKGTRESSDPRS